MTRERIPDGPVLQRAYGVLDKYKISRTFFVKTDQTKCETEAAPEEAVDAPDTGYDIVVDDDTVAQELYDNQSYGDQLQTIGYYRQNEANKTTNSTNKMQEKNDQTLVVKTPLPLIEFKASLNNATDEKPVN